MSKNTCCTPANNKPLFFRAEKLLGGLVKIILATIVLFAAYEQFFK